MKHQSQVPEENDSLQAMAEAISTRLQKHAAVADFTPREREVYYQILTVNFAGVVFGYAQQRNDQDLKRTGPHEIQGVNHDPNEVNPDTDAHILKRMDEAYFNFMLPVKDVRVAYFDYIVDKQTEELMDESRTAEGLKTRINDGELPPELMDKLVNLTMKNEVYIQQLDQLGSGLAKGVNCGTNFDMIDNLKDRNMAEAAMLLVDFAEACAPFHPTMDNLTDLLLIKRKPGRPSGIRIDLTNHLN